MSTKVTILNTKYRDFLDARVERQARIDSGELPGFPAETAAVREGDWRVETPREPGETGLWLAGVQGYREARAWADRFRRGEPAVEAGVGLRVDSLWAAFELDEIVYELRDFVAALATDDDGFLFSFVQAFHRFPEYVLPDRADMTPDTHFLRSFSRHVGSVADRRGPALAGDAQREATGSPMPVEPADLLLVPRGRITERGMRRNIGVVLQYLREDPADDEPPSASWAAELARAQLWQWVYHPTGVLDEGRIVTPQLFRELLADEAGRFDDDEIAGATGRLAGLVLDESFTMHAFCGPDA